MSPAAGCSWLGLMVWYLGASSTLSPGRQGGRGQEAPGVQANNRMVRSRLSDPGSGSGGRVPPRIPLECTANPQLCFRRSPSYTLLRVWLTSASLWGPRGGSLRGMHRGSGRAVELAGEAVPRRTLPRPHCCRAPRSSSVVGSALLAGPQCGGRVLQGPRPQGPRPQAEQACRANPERLHAVVWRVSTCEHPPRQEERRRSIGGRWDDGKPVCIRAPRAALPCGMVMR